MTFDGVDWHRSPDDDDLNMGLPEHPDLAGHDDAPRPDDTAADPTEEAR